jgi:malonyl-CoA O-methyltransferase
MSLNKQLVRQHFDRHAAEYDAHTPLQEGMGRHLLACCDHLEPRCILELGCGTGRLTEAIHERWPEADILAIDVAERMLDIAHQRVPSARFLCADAEHFDAEPVDLVISNATVQWFADPAASLALPSAHLAFSTFAANTFCELRACFEALGESERILPMPSIDTWRELAAGLGTVETCEVRSDVRHYPSLRAFVDTIRRSGASNAYSPRPLRPSRWRQVVETYPQGIPATYEQFFAVIRANPVNACGARQS